MNSPLSRALLLAMLFGLTACGGHTVEPPPVNIRVTRLADSHAFLVNWKTEQPTKSLVFERGSGFRQAHWQPVTKGLRFAARQGHDVLETDTAIVDFTVRVPEDFTDIPGEYPFLTAFSDGGLVLYTGGLDIASGDTTSIVYGPSHLLIDTGKKILTLDPPPDGSFVYLGDQQVRIGNGFKYIVDPKLPNWVGKEMSGLLPKLLELYGAKLRRAAPEPMVLIPFLRGGQAGMTRSGSVVGNQILLTLYSSFWDEQGAETLRELRKLVAHESFHLWNAGLFHNGGRAGTRWLHEGSADEFSFLALRELGFLSDLELTDVHGEALNRCVFALSSLTLPESDTPANLKNHYYCGSVIQSVLNFGLLKNASDLWSFWAGLFDRAEKKNGFYDPGEFFALANELTHSPSAVGFFKELTEGTLGGPGADDHLLEAPFFASYEGFGVGLIASETAAWPSWYSELVLGRALSRAISEDCGSKGYYIPSKTNVRLLGSASCHFWRYDLELDHIAGHSVWSEGVQAYDAIRKLCAEAPFFEVDSSSSLGALLLACPKLPPRPRYLSVQ